MRSTFRINSFNETGAGLNPPTSWVRCGRFAGG